LFVKIDVVVAKGLAGTLFFEQRLRYIVLKRFTMNVQPHQQMDNATFLDWVQGREERYGLAGVAS
jgi:hypothetical protein